MALLFSVLLVGYLFGVNVFAQWSIFDDHEIMWFLGPTNHIAFSQILPKLMLTEVGPQSGLPRFRPAYYSLRLLETWAWGKSPADWYLSHLMICLFFVWALWSRSLIRIGFLAGGLLTIYTMTFPFWPGIFASLGPGEAYAVLGLAFCVIGFDLAYQDGRSRAGWLLLFLGILIAAGSKENFVVLIFLMVFLLVRGLLKRSTNWSAWLASGAAIGWCTWIALVLYGRVQHLGVDVYGNSTQAGARLHVLYHALIQAGIMPFYAAALMFLLLGIFLRGRHLAAAPVAFWALAAIACIVGLYLSQAFFYNGDWPTGGRNDLPGMLCWPLALFVGLLVLRQLAIGSPSSGPRASLLSAGALLLAAAAVASNLQYVSLVRRAGENNVRSTTAFSAEVGSLAAVARQHPDEPLIFQSNDPADFEPLASYPRFLTSSGVTNRMYLLWIPARHGASNYAGSLSAQLTAISRTGAPGGYQPIATLSAADDECILILLGGFARRPCQIQVDGSWRRFY